MHICFWSCRVAVDCVLRREGKCVCSRWRGCSLLLRDNVSISFAYLFLSAAFPPVKLQGQFHQTNVVHYEPLWILNSYKLFSGVILALIKRYTVKCSLFCFLLFFFFFPAKDVCSRLCHFAVVKGQLAAALPETFKSRFLFVSFVPLKRPKCGKVWSVRLLTVKTRSHAEVLIHLTVILFWLSCLWRKQVKGYQH